MDNKNYWMPNILPELTEEYQNNQSKKIYLLPSGEKRFHPKWTYENGSYVDDEYLFKNENWSLILNFNDAPSSDNFHFYVENDSKDWQTSEDKRYVNITWKKYDIIEPSFGDEDYLKFKNIKSMDTWIFNDENMTLEKQYDIEKYSETELIEFKWGLLRSVRDAALQLTDWIIIQSKEKNINISQEVIDYRENLRNLPSKIDDISVYTINDIREKVLDKFAPFPQKPYFL